MGRAASAQGGFNIQDRACVNDPGHIAFRHGAPNRRRQTHALQSLGDQSWPGIQGQRSCLRHIIGPPRCRFCPDKTATETRSQEASRAARGPAITGGHMGDVYAGQEAANADQPETCGSPPRPILSPLTFATWGSEDQGV